MIRKSDTEQLSIKAQSYRFAFDVDFNLKRRIGAIRRPNMGNVINVRAGAWAVRRARLRAAVDPSGRAARRPGDRATGASRGTYSRIQLNLVTSSACVDGVCLPRGIRYLSEFERHLSLQRCVSAHV